MGEAAAFAMVGFGQVDELEVKAEGPRKLISGRKIQRADATKCLLQMPSCGGVVCRATLRSLRLATGDCSASQCLDGFVEGIAGLLAQDLAEKHAERSDIAAKRSLLQFARGGLEFGEALAPVGWSPQGRHA
jgi:hypothetical protein